MQCTRRQEIELAIQDQRRNRDGRKLCRQWLEVEKRFHEILQSIDIIGQPALPFDRLEIPELRPEPCIREVHWQQQVLQVTCPAMDQAGAQGVAEQEQLRRKLRERAHGRESGEAASVCDCVPQRNNATKTDAAQENRVITKNVDHQAECRDLVVLAYEQSRLVGCALTKQIECRNAESLRHQRIAVSTPEFGILRKSVNEHVGRPMLGAIQLVTDTIRAEGEQWHKASNENLTFRMSRFGGRSLT